MKLYMKQKFFSFADKFTIWDSNGNEKYYVQGEAISFGRRLHIFDLHGRELALVKQEMLTLLPKFYVFKGGNQIAQIRKEFSFFTPKYTVAGLNWEVSGNFLAHEYEVSKHGRPIVSISKEWYTWGDSFQLDIADGADEIVALAVVLAIDCVLDMQEDN